MRKIYPPLFNKFSVFVFYSLLSIVAGALSPCNSKTISSSEKHVTIGYVQLLTSQQSAIEPKQIPWKFYDFINVVAYQGASPEDRFNGIRGTADLNGIIAARNENNPDTKILLSIRNYDPGKWPIPAGDFADNADYQSLITVTESTVNNYNLDGVDIEYPGMRGLHCHGGGGGGKFIWKSDDKKDQDKKDGDFKAFIIALRGRMPKKSIMLTVGSDKIGGIDAKLINSIDYINIETYHHSLYKNLKEDGKPKTNPNAPLDEFRKAFIAWTASIQPPISSSKIIMGIDFGNTFQVVDNKDIEQNQIVETEPIPFPPQEQQDVLSNIKQINGLCPIDGDNELFLYSLPWNKLKNILSSDYCGSGTYLWKRGFDGKSPWLYKPSDDNDDDDNEENDQFYYISYEDVASLSNKLQYVTENKLGGVSISDVSYDSYEDGDNSLLGFMQVIREPTKPSQPAQPDPTSTNSQGKDGETHVSNPIKETNDITGDKPSAGAIVGAVFGSLIGLFVLGLFGFIGYRYRKEQPKSISTFLKSLPNRRGFPSSGNHGALSEMASDTTNHRVINNDSATVIPIASGYVTAMFDFTGKEENDLSFKKGDKIEVLERGDGPNDWWVGRVNGAVGEFPGNYVKDT